jgi:hypothetical protein
MEVKANLPRKSFLQRLDEGLTAIRHSPTRRDGEDVLLWQVDDDDDRHVKARTIDRSRVSLTVSDPGGEFSYRCFNVAGLQEAIEWVAAAQDRLGRHPLPPGGGEEIPVK